MAGGIIAWERPATRSIMDSTLERDQARRYSRHLLIPEIGEEGQRSCSTRACCSSAPAASARRRRSTWPRPASARSASSTPTSSTTSNLQRQVAPLHRRARQAEGRVGARTHRRRSTRTSRSSPYQERLTSENIDAILAEGWDVIVDGADNFPTRYLVNDASVWHGIPVVHGSIYRFEGQATVFKPFEGPCYRCLFPQPPPPELAPSCAEGGVLGVLPGVIGSIQANEAIKLALGIGEPLIGRLLLYDALDDDVHGGGAPPRPGLPGLRRAPDDHRVHRLRGVLRRRMTVTVRIPPTLRTETGGEREVPVDRLDRGRGARRPDAPLPGARAADLRRRRAGAVRERLRRRRGRAHAAGPRHRGQRRLHRHPAAGHGRRRAP